MIINISVVLARLAFVECLKTTTITWHSELQHLYLLSISSIQVYKIFYSPVNAIVCHTFLTNEGNKNWWALQTIRALLCLLHYLLALKEIKRSFRNIIFFLLWLKLKLNIILWLLIYCYNIKVRKEKYYSKINLLI